MKKYLRMITVSLLATGILFGCKKDSAPKPTCVIITASGSGGPTNFTYNSEGKLTSISAGALTKSLAYSSNTVICITTNSGVFDNKKIITLNSNGLAANVRIENNMAGTYWENYVFEYNGTELTKQTLTNYAGGAPTIATCTWNGGNLVTSVVGTTTTTFEYYENKPTKAGDYFHITQFIEGYESIRNKNALKSVLAGSNISNIDYPSDADGKITSLILTGSTSATVTYQYQCN
jgi:hypothetical protein